jgi:hypothetical protein
MIDQSEILNRSQVQFITLFCAGAQTVFAPFTSHGKLHEFGAEKSIPELSQHILTFSQ